MLQAIKELISVLQDASDGVVVGMAIAIFVLLIAHFRVWLLYRARLRDKDEHIEHLVEDRNFFQQFMLEERGIERKTTRKR